MDFKKMVMIILIFLVVNSFAIAQELNAKINYVYTGGNHSRAFVEVYSKNKRIFSKELSSGSGYYIVQKLLIIFEQNGEEYNNYGNYYFSSTVFQLKNNHLEKIYIDIKSDKSYKCSFCMAKPLYKNITTCKMIGSDFYKKINLLEKPLKNDDFIDIAKKYAIKNNYPYENKNSVWENNVIIGDLASIVYNNDPSITDHESIIHIIYIFKKNHGNWIAVYALDISTGRGVQFKDIQKKVPELTPEIAKKLGLRFIVY